MHFQHPNLLAAGTTPDAGLAARTGTGTISFDAQTCQMPDHMQQKAACALAFYFLRAIGRLPGQHRHSIVHRAFEFFSPRLIQAAAVAGK